MVGWIAGWLGAGPGGLRWAPPVDFAQHPEVPPEQNAAAPSSGWFCEPPPVEGSALEQFGAAPASRWLGEPLRGWDDFGQCFGRRAAAPEPGVGPGDGEPHDAAGVEGAGWGPHVEGTTSAPPQFSQLPRCAAVAEVCSGARYARDGCGDGGGEGGDSDGDGGGSKQGAAGGRGDQVTCDVMAVGGRPSIWDFLSRREWGRVRQVARRMHGAAIESSKSADAVVFQGEEAPSRMTAFLDTACVQGERTPQDGAQLVCCECAALAKGDVALASGRRRQKKKERKVSAAQVPAPAVSAAPAADISSIAFGDRHAAVSAPGPLVAPNAGQHAAVSAPGASAAPAAAPVSITLGDRHAAASAVRGADASSFAFGGRHAVVSAAGAAQHAGALEIIDTDGDRLHFQIGSSGSLQEYLNGQLEIDRITELHYDVASRKVADDSGEFCLRADSHVEDALGLRALAERAGVPWTGDEPVAPRAGQRARVFGDRHAAVSALGAAVAPRAGQHAAEPSPAASVEPAAGSLGCFLEFVGSACSAGAARARLCFCRPPGCAGSFRVDGQRTAASTRYWQLRLRRTAVLLQLLVCFNFYLLAGDVRWWQAEDSAPVASGQAVSTVDPFVAMRMAFALGTEGAGAGVEPTADAVLPSTVAGWQPRQLDLDAEDSASVDDVEFDIERLEKAGELLELAADECHGVHSAEGGQRKLGRACEEVGSTRAVFAAILQAVDEDGVLRLASLEVEALLAEAAFVTRRFERVSRGRRRAHSVEFSARRRKAT